MAPLKEGRQKHADARLSALHFHPAQTRRNWNEHCVTKSLFEQIWTFFNNQTLLPFAERLFHLHKVDVCYLNSYHERNEGLECLNCNKLFLHFWSAFKFLCSHPVTLFSVCLSGDRIVIGDLKFRRRSSSPPQRCGKSGSAVAVVLANRQIASVEGGDTETPAG